LFRAGTGFIERLAALRRCLVKPFSRTTSIVLVAAALGTGCASAPSRAPAGRGESAASAPTSPSVAGPAEHRAITTEALEPYECGSIARLHTLGGVFLASQPAPEDFAQAKKGGVRTVINLRHASEIKTFDERRAVEAEGMTYLNLPWNGPEELTDEVFDKAREYLKTAERPILLHCSSANRVGAVWLPHRVLDGGLSWEAALAEARTIGLKSPELEAKAKGYISRRRG
jgi:uncharacterized protein (TIGR01244 family)